MQGFRHRQPQPVIVYVDTRALSRESIGRWLAKHLSGFFIRTEPDDAGAAAFAAANERTAVVLKHLGSASATSGEVAASLTEFVHRLVAVPVAVFADSEEVDVVTAALIWRARIYPYQPPVGGGRTSLAADLRGRHICSSRVPHGPAAQAAVGNPTGGSAARTPRLLGTPVSNHSIALGKVWPTSM